MPNIDIPYIVRCEDERKKHTTDDTIMDIKPADYSLNVIKEYVIDIVCVKRLTEAIRYKLLLILVQAVSWTYIFSYISFIILKYLFNFGIIIYYDRIIVSATFDENNKDVIKLIRQRKLIKNR